MRHLAILLLCLCWLGCQQKNQVRLAKQIAEDTRQNYAPDKRVALFRVDTIIKHKSLLIQGETNLPDAKKSYFMKLDSLGIGFTDSLELLPSQMLEGKNYGVVNVSVCNMRSEPKHAGEMATQALLGTILRVWKKQGDFYLVQSPDDYFGWLDKGGLVLMSSEELNQWQRSARAICTTDFIFAYESPDEAAPKVTDLLAGNILQLVGSQVDFMKIKLPDGRIGFVKATYLVPMSDWLLTRNPTPENILASAKDMMGRPYLWGGASGKGMDCSGFTKMAFFLNGIQLPRDASQQVLVGDVVETDTLTWKNVLPGDLLFFGRKATAEKKERISHVAIYLGEGKIIHASDRVKIESLRRGAPDFAEDRVATFIRCKRIGQTGKNGVQLISKLPFY